MLGVGNGRDPCSPAPSIGGGWRASSEPGWGHAEAPNDAKKRERDNSVTSARTDIAPVDAQLAAIDAAGGDGVLVLGARAKLPVTNTDKTFFPDEPPITKGDLFRYYANLADVILPATRDRPLVLKRYPNGIAGKAFFQHEPPEEVPRGVWVRTFTDPQGETERRLVGRNLATLLYTVQLGAISYDPWHSRVPGNGAQVRYVDYAILDLDPGPEAPFSRVVEVACRTREAMDRLGLKGAVKTSGSSGLHIYLPLPPRTSPEAALRLGEIVATGVAEAYPKEATVERAVRERPPGTVYMDYLQNIVSKTVVGPYAVRAKPGATVSTPLNWDELDAKLDFRAFTLQSVPERVRAIGDLWAAGMGDTNDIKRALREGR